MASRKKKSKFPTKEEFEKSSKAASKKMLEEREKRLAESARKKRVAKAKFGLKLAKEHQAVFEESNKGLLKARKRGEAFKKAGGFVLDKKERRARQSKRATAANLRGRKKKK